MRALLIHQAFVTPSNGGGTRHYEFARHCRGKGLEIVIVTSTLDYLTGKPLPGCRGLSTEQQVDGLKVLRAYTYPSLHRSFVWRVVSFLSFMATSVAAGFRAGSVDVVMGTSPPIFQAVSAWLVAAMRRRPFLLEIRDLWPEFAVDMGILTNPFLIRMSRALESFLYARATRILVNSPAYRGYLVGKGIPEEKVSLISNGVDPTMFFPDRREEDLRRSMGLDDKFVVTYAGALGVANDIPTILRAAEELKDNDRIRFLIVGDGKERENLERFSAGRGLTNVIFTGSRPKAEIPRILAASDACVASLQDIPMFTTTYPNKVFDYMAAGRPTILAIDGVIREVIERSEGGIFVRPGDSRALADAVLYLEGHREVAERMGAAARAHVENHFRRADHAEAFHALLVSLRK